VSAIIDEWKRTVESFAKPYEEALGRLVDGLQKDARAIEAAGAWLGFGAALKERADRALEDAWARVRLSSAADVERIHDRLGAIEAALSRIDARLSGGRLCGADAAPNGMPSAAGKG
jgi:hypothetical protein